MIFKTESRGALKERIVELERSLKLAEAAVQKAAQARLLAQVQAEQLGARVNGSWMTLVLSDDMVCTNRFDTRTVGLFVGTLVLEIRNANMGEAVEHGRTASTIERYGAAVSVGFVARRKRRIEGELTAIRQQTPQEAAWYHDYKSGPGM